ncbi:MerR family transcriptional regulator [Agromyces sp. Marseille-P2726]|uniref:MerR family transcriptional regulator n=1 Tax=Agromyces sp. Marseille-P2726 TaxID=2709132 RepID=UPI001570B661|nr:MerR family transcriptional regulator [Agromyces sp. Marseille-P2726]
MKIGELSRRTRVPTRMLRYYEQQGLLSSERLPNGYRDYPESAVEQVELVRGLISSGLPTRLIGTMLGMDGVEGEELARTCSRNLAESLAEELATLESKIRCLERSRDTVRRFLARTRHAEVIGDARLVLEHVPSSTPAAAGAPR